MCICISDGKINKEVPELILLLNTGGGKGKAREGNISSVRNPGDPIK
jgi:hypothetical protein